MAFQKAGGATSSGQYQDDVRVVKKDSGFIYIGNKLTKKEKGEKEKKTEIRMLPYVDAEGTVWDPLNPEGDVEQVEESLGVPFFRAELLQFFKGGMHILLSSVKAEDKQGQPIAGLSPWTKFMNRMNFKLKEVENLKKAPDGCIEPEIAHWSAMQARDFRRPQTLWFIQALALEIDGEKAVTKGKLQPQGPGVFAIPSYIEVRTPFLTELLGKVDDGEPLSPTNNQFGDFYTPENGSTICLRRQDLNDNTTYSLKLGGRALPLTVEQIRKLVKPWDEILDVQYVEDSIQEIANLMEPRMVAYAFRNSQYAKYCQELGIDMSLADGVIEAEVEIVKGNRIRTAEEVRKHLGMEKAPAKSKFEEINEPSDDKTPFDIPEGDDIPFEDNDAAGGKDNYQEALKQMGDEPLEIEV
jgi:hypothetical protein